MPTGSKLYLSWWDFCGYLSDFEDFVYDGVFHKMDYHMWRKLKRSRDNETQVIIEKYSDSFIVIIGHEDECHYFCHGDESFGDFLFENLIDVKEYDHNWDKYNMPLSNSLNVPIAEAKVQCTTMESVKNIAIDCGEALKASAEATKDKLLDCLAGTGIGVVAFNTDPGPSISCVIDTKVDKAEFDSKLKALSDKIQAVVDKYNNTNNKENNIMNFNFDFGPVNPALVRMSMYGLAVKNKSGTWVSYNSNSDEIMDVDVLNFDGAKFLYRMPVAIKDITIGDVVIHNSAPMFVVSVPKDGKTLTVVDTINGERKDIMLPRSPFGFNFATKVVNFLGNMMTGANADNPFGNMWMLMAMSGEDKDMNNILPFLMMNNATVGMDNNMLMFMALSNTKDGSKDMLPWLLMSQTMNAAPVHECKCGGNCSHAHSNE